MKTTIYKSELRGSTFLGWLNAKHSFSFGGYYNPNQLNFGALRVLNDDIISEGKGFGSHPHNNMEIITIPLEGTLEHKDSLGNIGVINAGEIQVMSAGTGISHSEYNKNLDKKLKLLQIWIIPNKKNVTPRYDELVLNLDDKNNELHQIISPNKEDDGLWIHQDAWFNIGRFNQDFKFIYETKITENGIYAFVIKGAFEINAILLNEKDAMSIEEINSIDIKSISNNSEILLIEVPMNF